MSDDPNDFPEIPLFIVPEEDPRLIAQVEKLRSRVAELELTAEINSAVIFRLIKKASRGRVLMCNRWHLLRGLRRRREKDATSAESRVWETPESEIEYEKEDLT